MRKRDFGWSVGWRAVAPGSLRRLAAAAGRRSGCEGRYIGSLRGRRVCGDCLGSLTHRERAFGWSVGWRAAAPGSLRRLAAVAGRRSGVEGRYAGSLRGQGVCSDCFGPLTRRERLLTARMVVLVLLRRLGVWGAPSGPLCGAGASRAHARNGGFRPRPDPHACHASGARVCAD